MCRMLGRCGTGWGPWWCCVPGAGTHRARCVPLQVYESGSNVDQFVTRFLLKETANQTQSLLSSVESAVDAIDEQTNPARCAALLPSSGAGGGGGGCFCGVRETQRTLGRSKRELGEWLPFSLPPFPAS